MRIFFNGKYTKIPENSTLYNLMSKQRYDLMWSLVSINNRIIRHEIWEEKILKDNDIVEVLALNHLGEGI